MSSSNGVSRDAFNNSGTANGMASSYGSRATAASNILTPTLSRMATAPQGYGQQDLTNMNTAAMQGIGGATAGTVGQGNLQAARTNNAGGFAPVAAAAAHDATSQLSDAALGVQNQNAQLKNQQQQFALGQLGQNYGENVSAGEGALGLSNQALGVANQADQAAFARHMQLINSGMALLGAPGGA